MTIQVHKDVEILPHSVLGESDDYITFHGPRTLAQDFAREVAQAYKDVLKRAVEAPGSNPGYYRRQIDLNPDKVIRLGILRTPDGAEKIHIPQYDSLVPKAVQQALAAMPDTMRQEVRILERYREDGARSETVHTWYDVHAAP